MLSGTVYHFMKTDENLSQSLAFLHRCSSGYCLIFAISKQSHLGFNETTIFPSKELLLVIHHWLKVFSHPECCDCCFS